MRNLFLAAFLTHMLLLTSPNAGVGFANKLQGLRNAGVGFANKLQVLREAMHALKSNKAVITTVGILAAGTIMCSGLTMTGCDRGRYDLEVVDTEYIDPVDEAAGQYVTFYIDNQLFEGYWEITLDGQLLIEIDDGYGKTLLLEHMTGRRIRNHSDIGVEVVVQSQRNGRDVDKYGTVLEVYDNGFYVIDIYEIIYIHNGQPVRNINERLLINKSILPEDGGIEFLDE